MRVLPPLLLLTALAGCGGAPGDDRTDAPNPSSGAQATPRPTDPPAGALRLAVLGDSYSNGEAVGLERSWPAVMAGLLTRDGLATTVEANPSVTGATTAEMLTTGLGPIRASRPDVMTVMLGVNDQVQGRTAQQFAADEDRALTAAIEITGSPRRVIAVDIPDYASAPVGAQFGDPADISAQLDAFNGEVRRLAERHDVRFVSIVDISRRLGADGIAGDGLHPSAPQLAEWAARIADVAREQWDGLAPRTP